MSNVLPTQGRWLAAAPQMLDAAAGGQSPRVGDLAWLTSSGSTSLATAGPSMDAPIADEGEKPAPQPTFGRQGEQANPLDADSLAHRLEGVRRDVDAGAEQVRGVWQVWDCAGADSDLSDAESGIIAPGTTPPHGQTSIPYMGQVAPDPEPQPKVSQGNAQLPLNMIIDMERMSLGPDVSG